MNSIVYVTGNPSKAAYLAKIVNYPFEHFAYDHPEIQAWTLEEIVEEKVRAAYMHVGKAVLVEDVSLGLNECGGMPGPFIKFYVEPNLHAGESDDTQTRMKKLEYICRTADATLTRRATATCVMAYFDGKQLELMRNELTGTIADHPRGTHGFGWDAIFCPDGYNGKTRAELVPSDTTSRYPTIKPIEALQRFLTTLSQANS